MTALATMSAGWHRAGDSIAAFLLVGLCTTIAAGVVAIADPHSSDRANFRWPASTRWLAAVAAALLALGLALGVALNVAAPIRDATFGTWIAFGVGGLLITGTGIPVMGAILYALSLTDTGCSPSSRTASPSRG